MLKGNVYATLVDRLAALMSKMPKQKAKDLASILTCLIDATIAGRDTDTSSKVTLSLEFIEALNKALPAHMMNNATLSVPWDAFYQAHDNKTYSAQSIEFVCSVPAQVESFMRESSIDTGIWPGSLLDCMANAFANARKEVIVISPYWSRSGVEALLRRMPATALVGVNLIILTLPEAHHKNEAREALCYFKRQTEIRKATCDIRSFQIHDDWTPMLHAKALIADSNFGYMGSANFTGNGVDSSVEIGISFTGAKAIELRKWLYALSRQLVSW
jgi:hypothetical protein